MTGSLAPTIAAAADSRPVSWRARFARGWTRIWSHPALVRAVTGWIPGTQHPPVNSGEFAAEKVQRILVGRSDGIGDMILTMPLLAALRGLFPSAHVMLATTVKNAELIKGSSLVDEWVDIGPKAKGMLGRVLRWLKWSRACRQITAAGTPDLAIFPRWGVDLDFAPVMGYLSGARWRVGYSENVDAAKAKVHKGYDSLLTHACRLGCEHEVQTNLNVLKPLSLRAELRPASLSLSPSELSFAEEWLRERGLDGAPKLIALGIGANEPKRHWPIASVMEVVESLGSEFDARFLVSGGPQDSSDAKTLCDRFPSRCADATAGLGLRQSGALMSRCCLYLGNNSGPMHLAALVGVPILYASCHSLTGSDMDSNSDYRFGPFGVSYTCLRPSRPLAGCPGDCESGEPHCIEQVNAQEFLSAARRALGGQFENNSWGACARS